MAQSTILLTGTGPGEIVVPATATAAFVESWGAGGRYGGAYAFRLMIVTSGETIPFTIGSPGAAIAYNYNPTAGGNTTFASGARLVSAQGGPATGTSSAAMLAGDGGHVGGRVASGRAGAGSAGPKGIGFGNSGDTGGPANNGITPAGTTTGISHEDGGSGGSYRSSTNYSAGVPGGGYARGDEYSTAYGGRGQIRITWYEGEHVVRPISSSLNVATSGTYANATAGVGAYTSSFGWVGQFKSSATNFDVDQVMLGFDLTPYAGRVIKSAQLNLIVNESYGSVGVEVRKHDWPATTAAFIPASQIETKPLLGQATITNTGSHRIPLTGVEGGSELKIALVPTGQRTMTPPVGDDTSLLMNAQATLLVELGEPIVVGVSAKADVLSSSMSITGQPVVARAGALASVASGSLSLVGKNVIASAGALASPLAGSLAIVGAVAQASASAAARPSAGQVELTGNPVVASASARATPQAGNLSITTQPVTASAGATAKPAAGVLTITGHQVTATAGSAVGARAEVQSGSMQITGQLVSTSAGARAEPVAGSLVIVGHQVTASAGQNFVELYPDADCILNSLPDLRVLRAPVDHRVLGTPDDVRAVNTTSDNRVLSSI